MGERRKNRKIGAIYLFINTVAYFPARPVRRNDLMKVFYETNEKLSKEGIEVETDIHLNYDYPSGKSEYWSDTLADELVFRIGCGLIKRRKPDSYTIPEKYRKHFKRTACGINKDLGKRVSTMLRKAIRASWKELNNQ